MRKDSSLDESGEAGWVYGARSGYYCVFEQKQEAIASVYVT